MKRLEEDGKPIFIGAEDREVITNYDLVDDKINTLEEDYEEPL